MSVNAATLRRLAALRLAPEAMAEVLSIIADMQADDETRKAKDRDRKRNVRGQSKDNPRIIQGNSADIPVDIPGDTPSPKEIPPTPPKEITPTPNPELRSGDITRAREAFAEFRKIYPKRSGSQPWLPAEKKFLVACRGGADPNEILSGARSYAVAMAGEDPQFVAQAVTWINQQRWKDEHLPRETRAGPIRRNDGKDLYGATMKFIYGESNTYDDPKDRGGSQEGGRGDVLLLPPSGQ